MLFPNASRAFVREKLQEFPIDVASERSGLPAVAPYTSEAHVHAH